MYLSIALAIPAVVMAGYVFEKEQAQRFSRDWQKDLKRFGLPHAHMTDCATGNGHYQKLSMAQRIDSEKALIEHTRHRSLFGVATAVDYERYKAVFPKTGRFEFDAYTYCLSLCVTSVCVWAKQYGYDGQFAFIFESGHAAQTEANRVMNALREAHIGPSYSSHSFVRKEDAPPLQAADMLAWQYAHYLKRRTAGHPDKRQDFVALLRPKDRLEEYDKGNVDGLRQFTDKLKKAVDEVMGESFPVMDREQIMALAKERIRAKIRDL